MAKHLDFLIIGAQKSGTTSLHKYLEAHPSITMPRSKEAVFFTHDGRYAGGWDRFAADHYPESGGEETLWGKATPPYMADPVAPERIRATMPGTRVVALLRNPVDRAVSHYKMTVRRGIERLPLEQAMERLLEPGAAEAARRLRADFDAEARSYLTWGEYGRILDGYDPYFRAGRGLVLFTEELAADPQAVFARVMEFLGLPADFQPANLGERYHKGGTRRRLPMPEWVFRHGLTRAVGRLFPRAVRRRVIYWMNYSNVVHDPEEELALSPAMRARLVEYFRDDVRRVAARAGRPVPWPEFGTEARP